METELEKVVSWALELGLATGHADTLDDLLGELKPQIKQMQDELYGASEYKPGDLPPEGYQAWHDWAVVQRKAGIEQAKCVKCGKWRTPQELNGSVCKDQMCGEKSTG